MRLAGIIVTYNDSYKFKEWCRWYEEYKDELYKLIIVDNGSEPEYLHQVETYFVSAIIIKRDTNGGSTIAYNDGIRLALADPQVTHIALIGNDIRLSKGSLCKCVELLESDDTLGMVAPILLNADSDIVADFGDIISEELAMVCFGKDMRLEDIPVSWRYCEGVTGGMNVSKRSFYETTVGLQDENLFMYSDEADMAIRARKAGVKMAATKEAIAWHQHINPPGNKRRHPYSNYLIARNKVYLGGKHFGTGKKIRIFNHFFFLNFQYSIKCLISLKWSQLVYPRWAMLGAVNGLLGNMKENKYSKM